MKPASILALLLVSACSTAPVLETAAGIGGVLMAGQEGLPALETGLYMPTAVTFTPEGRLLIDDFNNFRIRELQPDGTLRTVVGIGAHGVAGGPAATSYLENPIDLAWHPDGDLLIAELHTGRILRVRDGEVSALAGGADYSVGHSPDGTVATLGLLGQSRGVATDEDGTVYISDTDNHCIRMVSPDGVLSHLAGGLDGERGFADGPGEEARFFMPERIRRLGRSLWIADAQNHAIRRLDLDTHEVTTIAGTGTAGFAGDGGPGTEAMLAQPTGMLPEADGGVWIADSLNHRIRYLDASGVITTVAGDGEPRWAGDDGHPLDGSFNFPADLTRGPDGDLYVADLQNGAVRRLVRPDALRSSP